LKEANHTTEPFFIRLKEYYSQVGKVLQGEAEIASIFPNPTDKGITRENIYLKFLEQHLPSGCNIFSGGFLFDLNGQESKQIDIIITSDSSIQFNFFNNSEGGKSFACIEGTIAVASIKSNLTSQELEDTLNNFATIPDKEPLEDRCSPVIDIPEYGDWPFKIIFATKGATLDTLLKTINKFYQKNPDIPMNKRPNLIHIAGKGCVIRIPHKGFINPDGTKIEPNTFGSMDDETDVFALMHAQQRIQMWATASRHIFFNYSKLLKNM